tara:strand:+ start:282 stop:530 length:249 start_codon:yes stop_codon:yes gene_type:complete
MESGAGLTEQVSSATSRFQDYTLFESRLKSKYLASLEAQRALQDANNDLAICIQEYGKKFSQSEETQSVGQMLLSGTSRENE